MKKQDADSTQAICGMGYTARVLFPQDLESRIIGARIIEAWEKAEGDLIQFC